MQAVAECLCPAFLYAAYAGERVLQVGQLVLGQACVVIRRDQDNETVSRSRRPVERVQTLLAFDDVLKVQSQGIERGDKDMVLSLLTLTFEPSEDGAGRILLTFAGDGALALEVEAINIMLQDVTRPYIAPSRQAPSHPE